MTAIEYMEKQVQKHRLNHKRESERGVPEEMLRNIEKKIGYYEAAVDALKVVRRKDCVHGRPYGDQEEYIMCEDSWDLAHPRNHFCSYGKRKDGEQA